MTRPLRIEYANALYHVTARGNQRGDIFLDDTDRYDWLAIVGEAAERFQWVVYAYCLMLNHFHLMVQTLHANLSRCMHYLNGVYTQRFNRRHMRCGHVLQGRYHAVLIDEEAYLLRVARYVLLNPVRAGFTPDPSSWQWSSYRATCAFETAPSWLGAAHLLQRFSHQPIEAIREFERFVNVGTAATSPWDELRQQVFLGDIEFVAAAQARMTAARREEAEIPSVQRDKTKPCLTDLFKAATDVPSGVCAAYHSGDFTMRQIATHLGIHYSTVSRVVRRGQLADL